MKIPINYVVLEGVDLSGKTTMYNKLHKVSGFRWNIQDRSSLSMLIYGKMYGRDLTDLVHNMKAEYNNLNNRFVFCRPSFNTIESRYHDRGDEIQNLVNLESLYDLFDDHDWVCSLPNVHLANTDMPFEELVEDLHERISSSENLTIKEVSNLVKNHVANSLPRGDHRDLRSYEENITLTMIDDGEDVPASILNDEVEGEYYRSILESFTSTIYNELEGKNEYGMTQDIASRRFIHTSNTCISLIQCLYRNNTFNFNCVLRSSNVVTTLHKDLAFLVYLAREVAKILELSTGAQGTIKFKIDINSGHLVK